jgi:tRNA (mo5U34)-methyltransferase
MSEPFALLPRNPDEFVERAHSFRSVLQQAKEQPPAPNLDWYPYDSMASIDHARLCLETCFPEFLRALRSGPLLDIGCADGDLSVFFASLGLPVTAIDNRPTNFNWMSGIHALRERLGMAVDIVERDIDEQWPPPEKSFGLTLLLGILYHLKNPYHVLESLAKQSRYCLLSTRIAAATPKGTTMDREPLVYLLDGGEANDDETNYWIFSPAALSVLVRRAGWKMLGRAMVGDNKRRPEPVRSDRDAREFLFLRSTRLSAPAHVTLGAGWGDPEPHGWAWTLKRFSFTLQLLEQPVRSFSLRFRIPQALAAQSGVAMTCLTNGIVLPRSSYSGPGDFKYEALLPASVAQDAPILFEFAVEHKFQPAPPETRDLGVIVSLRREVFGVSERIPFYLD